MLSVINNEMFYLTPMVQRYNKLDKSNQASSIIKLDSNLILYSHECIKTYEITKWDKKVPVVSRKS